MRAIREKTHYGEYHGQVNGMIYVVYRTDLHSDIEEDIAIPKIQQLCADNMLPNNLMTGAIRIFRNETNKQNSCWRFEVRVASTKNALKEIYSKRK